MSGCLRWSSAVAAVVLTLGLSVAHAAEQEAQAWLLADVRFPIGEKFTGVIEGYARFGDDLERLSITQARASVLYEISPVATIGAGYGHAWFYREGAANAEENRTWQELTLRPRAVEGLSLRTRIEQRFLMPGEDAGFRLREQVKLKRPIHGGASTYLYGSGEVIFSLKETDWGARDGFEQLRLSAGGGFRLNDHARIETGYLNQFLPRPDAEDHMNHVLLMVVSFEP